MNTRADRTDGRRGILPRLLLVGLMMVSAASAVACSSYAAPTSTPGPAPGATPVPAAVQAPTALAPPPGQRLVLQASVATGAQVYACHAGTWALKQPRAALTSPRGEVLHGAGPSWTATSDHSSITGAQVASVPSPNGVPELLLRVSSHQGAGALGTVEYVQRLATVGGQAPPPGPCAENAEHESPYRAVYRFFTAG